MEMPADRSFTFTPDTSQDILQNNASFGPTSESLYTVDSINPASLMLCKNPVQQAVDCILGSRNNEILRFFVESPSTSVYTPAAATSRGYFQTVDTVPADQESRPTTRSQSRQARDLKERVKEVECDANSIDNIKSVETEDRANRSLVDPSRPSLSKPRRSKHSNTKSRNAQKLKDLERNRTAAAKCRQRKRKWTEDLEVSRAQLETENNRLSTEHAELVGEILDLKNLVILHAQCNDPKIDGWLAKEAGKYAKKLL